MKRRTKLIFWILLIGVALLYTFELIVITSKAPALRVFNFIALIQSKEKYCSAFIETNECPALFCKTGLSFCTIDSSGATLCIDALPCVAK